MPVSRERSSTDDFMPSTALLDIPTRVTIFVMPVSKSADIFSDAPATARIGMVRFVNIFLPVAVIFLPITPSCLPSAAIPVRAFARPALKFISRKRSSAVMTPTFTGVRSVEVYG